MDLIDHIAVLRRDLEDLMEDAGINLWACPAARGPAPEGLHATGDRNMNLPWTHAGLPSITLPAGLGMACRWGCSWWPPLTATNNCWAGRSSCRLLKRCQVGTNNPVANTRSLSAL